MMEKHGVRPGEYRKGRVFEEEARLAATFEAAGASSSLVYEVLSGVPTMATLLPGGTSPETQAAVDSILPDVDNILANMPEELPDVEPLSDDDQLLLLLPATYPDDPASYADPDQPDKLDVLSTDRQIDSEVVNETDIQTDPVPGPSSRPDPVPEPSDSAPIAFLRRAAAVKQQYVKSNPKNPAKSKAGPIDKGKQPAVISHQTLVPSMGKNSAKLREIWEVGEETSRWSLVKPVVSNVDITRVLDNMPSISGRKATKLISKHFSIPSPRRAALRLRATAMIEMEELIYGKIRKLLPASDSDTSAAVVFTNKVRELCTRATLRPSPTPFD